MINFLNLESEGFEAWFEDTGKKYLETTSYRQEKLVGFHDPACYVEYRM